MRKLLSIALLFVLALGSLAPAFALGDDSSVPACCRGNGAHKCMRSMGMAMAAETDENAPHVNELRAKCPCCPASTVSLHAESLAGPRNDAYIVPVIAHPAGVVQTESRYRVARDRSRQKRGPPTLLS